MSRYDPSVIEPKWQAAWDEAQTFRASREGDKPKYYVLEMFPYPSGRIHIGHVRNYTMGDVIARYKLSTGHNVLHPMGFDAFGMPAENAAMKSGGHPKTWTYDNIDTMVDQMKPLGFGLDWSRMFATCDPEYYGQQQALFLDFLEEGLVYRKNAVVNWDPVDMTVLANEQVIDGKGWRSGAEVERRELTQWFFKISDMAGELLDAIDGLDEWPAKVKLMQQNWIGKSRGLQFAWDLTEATHGHDKIEVYTTRPDTLMGASFLGLSPDHPLTKALEADNPDLAAAVAEMRKGGTTEEALQLAFFREHGYLRIEQAFPRAEALAMQDEIWEEIGAEYGILRADESTWKQPWRMPRKAKFSARNERLASPRFRGVISDLLGDDAWPDPGSWGGFLITFPDRSGEPWDVPLDTWHWDGSPGARGLLIISFYSKVEPGGGGTSILSGSPQLIRRFYESLAPEDLARPHKVHRRLFATSDPWLAALTGRARPPVGDRVARFMARTSEVRGVRVRVVELTGEPGDAVFCDLGMVHAVSRNCSRVPRFMRTKFLFLGSEKS